MRWTSPLLWIALCLACFVPSADASDNLPAPAEGRAAATTLALLEHQRETCDTIAGRVLEYWGGLGEIAGEDLQSKLRDFTDRQVSDLAGSRLISDLVERFLPIARRETTDETAGSLRRLANVAKEMCDVVALPTPPQQAFADRVSDLLDRFEFERVELGRLLVVPEADLDSALEPYIAPIQIAGVEAEGEYLAWLASQRDKPKLPTMAEVMHTWHTSTYKPGVAPTKKALGVYLKARSQQDVRQIGRSCRQLAKEVIHLLREDSAFQAPDERVTPLLRPIYLEIRGLATSCTAGNQKAVDKHFEGMQEKLKTAADFMARYRLRP